MAALALPLAALAIGLSVSAQAAAAADFTHAPQATRVFDFTDDSGVTHLTNVPETRAAHLLVDDGVPVSGSGRIPHALPDSAEMRRWVEDAAADTALEPALVYAVMAVESGYNPRALSPKGAAGLMQLMPDTALRYGVADRFDGRASVRAGACYLRDLLVEFAGRVDLALAAYNAGSQAVLRAHDQLPPYAETRAYVPRVLEFYRQHGGQRWPNP